MDENRPVTDQFDELENRVKELEEAVDNIGNQLSKFIMMQLSINDTLRELVVRKYGKHELNTALKEIETKLNTNLKKKNGKKKKKMEKNEFLHKYLCRNFKSVQAANPVFMRVSGLFCTNLIFEHYLIR